MSLEFKIFTLNAWGLPLFSKDRKNRIKAIAEFLSNSEYDVVCLQEVWTDKDYYLIKNEISKVLPYSHYFYSGVTGSGICVFSKHFIQETFFHQWPINGYIHKIQHGDWFGGKGVGLCKLTVNNFSVNIYTAHLHAEYNRNSDEYEAHRILQAYNTAQFIMLTSQCTDLVILAGDLNTLPGDLAYSVIKTVPGLIDAFDCCEVSKEDEATCESLKNSYTSMSSIKKKEPGQRIDYIMYHPGSRLNVNLKSYKLPLPERVPCCSYSYSDHEGIEATLEVNKNVIKNHPRNNNVEGVLRDCIIVLNRALDNLVNHKMCYYFVFLILMCVLIISFGFDAPSGLSIVYNFLRVLIAIVTVFCFLMAAIWNKIERHGILAAKLSMEKTLEKDFDS